MIDPQLAAMTEITIERQDSTTATMTLRDLLDDRRAEPWLLQIVGILCRAAADARFDVQSLAVRLPPPGSL